MSDEIQRSLRISWTEGLFAVVMVGVVDYYAIPYALFLGAATPQVGLLAAIPQLLAAGAFLTAATVVEWIGSRRRCFVLGAWGQAAVLIPVALLATLEVPGRVAILTLCISLHRMLGGFILPAWGSLMSDYLPAEARGSFFGSRSRAIGVVQMASMGLAGAALFLTKRAGHPAWGFGAVFLAAALGRGISARYLARMTDLPMHRQPGDDVTFLRLVRGVQERRLLRFVAYVAGLLFMAFLAAPYFSVYMLRDLRMSYLAYMAVHLAGMTAAILAYPVWGRHADVVGNARILKMTGAFLPFMALLWLGSRQLAYLIVVEFLSGIVWGGFMLCATNYVYDAAAPHHRVRYLGYFNLVMGLAIFAGASLGGVLAEWLPPLFGFRLLALIALSGALRLLAYLSLVPGVQEVRAERRKASNLELLLSVVGIRSLLGEQEGVFPPARTPPNQTGDRLNTHGPS